MTPDTTDLTSYGCPLPTVALASMTARGTTDQLPRPAKGEQYLGGPVPMGWLEAAAALPGKAMQLGIALWYTAVRSKNKSPRVRLSNALATRFGLAARTTRSRALDALAGAGLVRVETNTGRAPVVTILPAPTHDEPDDSECA